MGLLVLALLFTIFAVTKASAASDAARSHLLSEDYQPGDTYMGIRLLGSIKLFKRDYKKLLLTELSGLAWDEDEKILYAVSDNGYLFHLNPVIKGNRLIDVEVTSAVYLKDKKGRALGSPGNDSEGLSIAQGNNGIKGDTELIISFERRPRILVFRPNGTVIRDHRLPPALRDIRKYQSANKALESVSLHHGTTILTAPERPLRHVSKQHHAIYSLDGRSWLFKAYKPKYSALVAIESLSDDSILVMERIYSNIFTPLLIALRKVTLTDSSQNNVAKVEDIAVFDNHQGWHLDNFEGLTRFRGQQFFIISDDNDNPLQNTLLILFELLPKPVR